MAEYKNMFITRYALTRGILYAPLIKSGGFYCTEPGSHRNRFKASEVHETFADATLRARILINNKRASLRRQLRRLELLAGSGFEDPSKEVPDV